MKRLSRWLRLDRFFQTVLASRQRGFGWVLRWLGKTFRGSSSSRPLRPRFLPALETLEGRVTPTNVHFNASSFSVGENAGPGLATVVLEAASANTITVEYATSTAGASATAGSDYTATSGTLTFAPSETTKTISIAISNDSTDEIDEMFGLTLTNAVNAIIDSPSLAPFTITDDDAAPMIEFSTGSQSAAENAGTITAYLSLSAASGKSIGVTVTPSGTASSAIDYTLTPAGAVTIAPGATTLAIGIAIINDSLDEFDETVILTIDGTSNATVGTTTIHTATITDNDAEPTVQFTTSGVSSSETSALASVTLSLSAISGKTVTVPLTMSGTATNGSDYTAPSSVTIAAGSATVAVVLTLINDPIDEDNETAIISIGTPTNATAGTTSVATVTITDDDPQPTIDFNNGSYSVGEGDGNATLTVRLLNSTMSATVSGKTITVYYTTADITASSSDYTGATSAAVTILPGNSTGTLTIPITNDTIDESNETVRITLSAPVNASLGTMPMMFNNTVTLTINDNDPFPDVAFSSSTSQVGEADGTATFTVNLAASSAFTTTVKYATSNGTASSGSDYTATTGTLTFTPGQTSKTFTVAITNDSTEETHETVSLTLSNPSSLTLVTPSVAVLTIIDNDGPSISFVSSSESVAENAGNKTMTVTLSNASAVNDITVVYATAPGTATQGSDYTTTSGTLTFTTGQTSKTFTVPILDDALDEDDETLSVVLSSANHANLVSPSTTVLTITDNDAEPTVQFSSATYGVTEGSTATIVANLSAASGKDITVVYATSNGTALSGSDYTATTGTLTFAASLAQTSQAFTVVLAQDAVNENDESISLSLSSESNATLGSTSLAILTIQENDAPTISAPSLATTNEDASLVFSSGNGNGIGVSLSTNHLQSPSQTLQVTLTVAHGAMSLNGTSGLTFTTGDGTGDASMVFTGRADDISSALTTLTYLPTANYNGSDTLTLKSKNVSNTLAPLDTDNVTLTIVSVNDAPDAVDNSLSTNEDTTLNISLSTLLSNDTDVDGPTTQIVNYTQPTNGSLSGAGLVLTYTPTANFHGTDSFTYTIKDGAGGSDTATVTISVASVNDDPVAKPDHGYTPVSTAVTLSVLGNDTDADADTLTLTSVTQGTNGTVSIDDNSTPSDPTDDVIIYTPSATFTGQDTFTYTVTDGNSGTDTGTVTVTVRNGQWATSVVDVSSEWSYSGAHDWYAVQVLGQPDTLTYGDNVTAWAPEGMNDTVPGTAEWIIVGFSIHAPADGILIRETYGNGFVTAIDLLDTGDVWHTNVWSGTDPSASTLPPTMPADSLITFSLTSYSVKAARVHIDVGHNPDAWEEIDAIRLFGPSMTPSANNAPTATVAPVTLSEDASASISLTLNDTDTHALFLSVISQPSYGYVELSDNGTRLDLSDDYFIYTPDPDFTGTDSFAYQVSDHFGGVVSGTVSLTVTNVNDAPVLGSPTLHVNAYKNAPVTLDTVLTLSDASDVETVAISLSVSVAVAPAHGTTSITSGTLTYTPTSGFVGLDKLTYTVSDGAATASGVIYLTVYEDGYWATSVTSSSVYDPGDSSGDWGVSQVLNAPDTFAYGDMATAWAPEEDDDGEQWITANFTPAYATGVLIRETNGNGFVTKIDIQYVGDSWATSYWTGTDTSTQRHATDFIISFPTTTLQVQAVKVYVDTDFASDTFEEIDAIRLLTGGSPASMSVTTSAHNQAPLGTDDWGSTNKNTAVTLDVVANDDDPDGDTLTLTSVSPATSGTVTFSGGNVTYTPATNFVGTDTFTYTVSDGHGGTDTATVTIRVEDGQWATSILGYSSQAVIGPYGSSAMALGPSSTTIYGDTSHAWSPNPSSTATSEYVTFGIASQDYATGVLVRQVSGNGFITKIEFIDDSDDPHTIFESPTDTDDTAPDRVEDFVLTFTTTGYLVKGVKITVDTETADGYPVGIGGVKVLTASAPSSPPSAPTATNDSASTGENMPVNIDVLANDTLSSTKRIEIVSGPSHGTAAVDLNGTPDDASDDFITYWGEADFNGSDSFTYRLSDRYGQSSTATVSLTVTEVNSGPIAGTGSAVGSSGNPIWINVLPYATDGDGDDLEILTVHDGQNGTAVIDDNDTPEDASDDMVMYTPDEGFSGVDAVGYVISDGEGGTSWGTINVTIYGDGGWAIGVGQASSAGDNGWGEASEVIGVADTFSSGDASGGWSPTDGGLLEFLTVTFTEQEDPATGLVIRQSGDGGLVRRVDLIDDGGGTHVIWAATDPTTGGVHDFILDFPAVEYDVVGARIYVDGSSGTPIIDAVKLRIGGSAEALTLSSWSYSDTQQIKTVYNDAGLAETATVYYHGRVVQTTTTEYDGEVVEAVNVADALGRITRTEYDENGRVAAKILAYDTADEATTSYEYDEDGNLISLTDPNGNITTWEYDAQGREISMTDPLGQIDPEGHTVFKTYDEDGRLASILNRNGLLRTFDYDEDGRLIEEVWYAGATTEDDIVETFTWNYNAQGLLQSATNNAGTYEFEYDDLGRLIHVLEPFAVELTFGYDVWGYRNLVVDSLGGVERSLYDPSGLLLSRRYEDTNAEVRLDYAYTDVGQVATITRYSDLAGTELVAVSTYDYDWEGRLTSLVHTDAEDDPIADYAWEYDAAGQLVSQTDHSVTVDYVYDDQGQLISEDNGALTEYTYDANGNRDDANYDVGDGNRLTTDGVWNYDYDNEGNLIQKTHIANEDYWTYDYDHANHLIEARHFDDEDALLLEADYAYDAFGNRIQKTVDWDGEGEDPAEVEKYAYDGWNNLKSSSPVGTENWDIWADLDNSDDLVTRYVRGDIVDQFFARVAENGDTLWNLTDHLGSLRDVIDNTGAVVDSIVYDAFGRMTESDPEYGGRYKWTSREFDVETGLQFNRARYYDADTGRWISQDPLGFDAGDSNLYRYVANRPTGATDPSGKQQQKVGEYDVKNGKGNKIGRILVYTEPTNVKGNKNVQALFDSVNKDDSLEKLATSLNESYGLKGKIDHFNWFQTTRYTSDDGAVKDLPYWFLDGKKLQIGKDVVDPPPGGYYQKDPATVKDQEPVWADNRPWYWDEVDPPKGKKTILLKDAILKDKTLFFWDRPIHPPGVKAEIITLLAPIDKDGKWATDQDGKMIFLGGFAWELVNKNGKLILQNVKESLKAPPPFIYDSLISGFYK